MSTNEFIIDRVQTVFDDFVCESWCSLKRVALNTSSYINRVNQQAYLLKYYSAYFCEYYMAYNNFFDSFHGDSLTVMSLGYGAGIDCDALFCVIGDREINCKVKYYGVDCVDWAYKIQHSGVVFKNLDIKSISSDDVCDVDLFVFPKSLTELDDSRISHVGSLIANSSKKGNVFFLNSYITDDASQSDRINGLMQFNTIHDKMTAGGWMEFAPNESKKYNCLTNQGWLGHTFDFFKIPDVVLPFVSELNVKCLHSRNDFDCFICDISFKPILMGKYMAFALLKYTKVVL